MNIKIWLRFGLVILVIGIISLGIGAEGCPWANKDEDTIAGSSAPLPSAVSALNATAISSSQINLSWDDNSNSEDGVKIERKTGVEGTYSEIDSVGADITVYPDTGLAPNTTYYYRVRAYNENGDSMYSNEASATTQETPIPEEDYQVSASADDSWLWLSPSNWSYTEIYNVAGYSSAYGVCRSECRFTGINVPQGATVLTATISYHCNGGSGGAGTLTKLQGEATDNATQIVSQGDFESRTRTTARVDYDDASWSLGTWYEINITSVIQEIINRSGWSEGNALRIFFEDDGSPTSDNYRLVASSLDDGVVYAPHLYIDIGEAEPIVPPDQVTSPNPSNGVTDIPITTSLSWGSASGATSYDVYFGTDNPPLYQTNTTLTSFNPGPLTYTTTYYWQIDARNEAGTTTGNTWNFQTTVLVSFPPEAPQNPWCEGTDDPIGVSDPSPEFSAVYTDADADNTAVSYYIQVGIDMDWGVAEMWDSGELAFATPITNNFRCTDISYAGSILTPSTTYYWRIRFYDNWGAVGAWSSGTDQFTMGANIDGEGDYQVSASADDSTYGSLSGWLNANAYLPAGDATGAGFGTAQSECLFRNIDVPQGVTIKPNTYIRFHCKAASGGAGKLTKLQGEAIDNATPIISQADFLGRTRTTAKVDYDDADWTAGTWYEINIQEVIQEIVNRSGWSTDNALRIFFEDDGSDPDMNLLPSSWDDGGAGDYAPRLHIEYDP